MHLIGFNPILRYAVKTEWWTMRTTQQFSITLPLEMAEVVEGKIKSGAYASVSEVMRDGVRALLERDAAIERWLREEWPFSLVQDGVVIMDGRDEGTLLPSFCPTTLSPVLTNSPLAFPRSLCLDHYQLRTNLSLLFRHY